MEKNRQKTISQMDNANGRGEEKDEKETERERERLKSSHVV